MGDWDPLVENQIRDPSAIFFSTENHIRLPLLNVQTWRHLVIFMIVFQRHTPRNYIYLLCCEAYGFFWSLKWKIWYSLREECQLRWCGFHRRGHRWWWGLRFRWKERRWWRKNGNFRVDLLSISSSELKRWVELGLEDCAYVELLLQAQLT